MELQERDEKKYKLAFSGGKDSMATLLLALENNETLDEVVYCRIMYDNSRNISAEYPIHEEWLQKVAFPFIRKYTKLKIVQPKLDFITSFNSIIGERGKYAGEKRGFLICRACILSGRKQDTVRKHMKNCKNYVGIAYDEPTRLERLHKNNKYAISLLEKYRVTEEEAKEICVEHNMLSPQYQYNDRNGCFFCPNAKIRELKTLPNYLLKELFLMSMLPEIRKRNNRFGIKIQQVYNDRFFQQRLF